MVEHDSFAPGTPCWVDLGTVDPAASAAFYGALFGWSCDEGPPEAGGYRMCMLRGRPVAGIGVSQNPPDWPPWWATYVAVDDADATAAAVTAAGGTVLAEPFDILDVGRMAVFADPAGHACSVWQAQAHAGAGIVNEHGTLTWNEVLTHDLDAARRFYTTVFGWKADDGFLDDYAVFFLDDRPIGGAGVAVDGVAVGWLTWFAVDDCDAAVASAVELGAKVLRPPETSKVGRTAIVADPAGATFGVLTGSEG